MGTRRANTTLIFLVSVACLFFACRAVDEVIDPTSPGELDLWNDAGAGVQDPLLAGIVQDSWEAWLKAHPIQATILGDPRYGDRLPGVHLTATHQRRSEIAELRGALQQIDFETLSETDRITANLLDLELEEEGARIDLGIDEWTVDPIEGLHLKLFALAEEQSVRTAVERERFVERWGRVDTWLRQIGDNLKRGHRNGRIASRTAVTKTIAQLEAILATPPMDSPMVRVAMGGGRWVKLPPNGSVSAVAHEHLGDARKQRLLRTLNRHLQDGERLVTGTRVLLPPSGDPLSAEERGEFLYATLCAVEENIYPGLTAYRDLLADDILPAARPDDRPGLTYVAGGRDAYPILIREYTSLPLAECDPRVIHEFGLAEVARIRREISELGRQVFGTPEIAAIQARLREDPEMHFQTREEVESKATEALYRARAKVPAYFGRVPETTCEVMPVPAFAERDGAVAYYGQPDAAGLRPGRYFVNTCAPETRPRYEAEVLAFHETFPGRHLQTALQQESAHLPRFRRHLGSEAFVQGWALYAGRLCDEMGLYSSDVDRLGALSFEAWRAGRLVVDTGLHAFGWSRDEAIRYLHENSLLAAGTVESEVDRTIACPGRALSDKIGQREILALRDHARNVQGASFSYPRFHDRLLERGAVSLPVLREGIARWLGVPVPQTARGG